MGAVSASSRSFTDLIGFRIVFGVLEARFKPCAMFRYSKFYTRHEISVRTSAWGMTGFNAVRRIRCLITQGLTPFQGAVGGLIAWDVFQWEKELFVSYFDIIRDS
jgi:hypothetical protein